MALGGVAAGCGLREVGMGVNYVGWPGDPFTVDLDGNAEPVHRRPPLPSCMLATLFPAV